MPIFASTPHFVDIETTGLSPERGIITLIGVLDDSGYTAYVYDENLADFREAMEQYDLSCDLQRGFVRPALH